jgi:hypothetical protein
VPYGDSREQIILRIWRVEVTSLGVAMKSRRGNRKPAIQARKVWSAAEVRALGVSTDLETAGSVLRIGRTKAHELARSGKFPAPVLRLGNKYMVPTAPLLALLHLGEPDVGPNEAA